MLSIYSRSNIDLVSMTIAQQLLGGTLLETARFLLHDMLHSPTLVTGLARSVLETLALEQLFIVGQTQ